MSRLPITVAALGLAGALAFSGAALVAQSAPPEPLPAFEVATVRVNRSAQLNRLFRPQPGGRFDATNLSLVELIRFAYQVRPFQIEGAPGWASTISYDIVAKAAEDAAPPMPGGGTSPVMLMMRSLLADRFKLVVHKETREAPIYALSLARGDGRLGPNMSQSTTDCAALAKASAGGPPPPPPPGKPMACVIRIAPGRLEMGGFALSELGNGLATLLGRTVVDRTGLKGNYELMLTFSPEQLPGMPMPPDVKAPVSDPNLPSIFTALQEQAGLKLESTRGPVELLVIDRAEMPTED